MDPLESYYEVVSQMYRMARTVFDAYCYVLWVKPSLTARKKLWRIGAVYVAVIMILGWMPYYINKALAYGLGTLAAFLVMCLLDREDYGQKVFLAITFFCMRWQTGIMIGDFSNSSHRLHVALLLKLKGHEFLSFFYQLAIESYEYWFYNFVFGSVIEFVLGATLMYGAVWLMRRAYGSGRSRLQGKELLFLCTPSVAGIFAYGIAEFYRNAYEAGTTKSVYDLKGQSLLVVLYSLACYFTILVMVYVFQRWKEEQEADEKRRIFTAQMKDMQAHIEEVERLYSDMRRLRHDMGNHLMTLEELYARGEYEAAGRYAESMKTQMQEVSTDMQSGHPVTDAILSVRKGEMEEKGIAFSCDFHYPQSGDLNVFDLSIILNNALANAIEASVREPYREIRLTSRLVKNMYIIEVVNVFTGELRVDAVSGLPLTTKTEEGHGFGLSGIRHVAQKYYGDVEIGVEECGRNTGACAADDTGHKYDGIRYCMLRVMLQIEIHSHHDKVTSQHCSLAP